MSVHLLQVGDHLSLEIDADDLDRVRSYIQQMYPDVSIGSAGITTVVSFGGSECMFQNEWDDPCLISGSLNGDTLLRRICDYFATK